MHSMNGCQRETISEYAHTCRHLTFVSSRFIVRHLTYNNDSRDAVNHYE